MSFASQATQQKFPFSYDAVFNGLMQVLPSLGMNVKNADKVIGRINASTGMSLFSWGENLTLIVEKVDDSSCAVSIESGLKVGINAAGAHRHSKNFNNIISALSKQLQATAPPTAEDRAHEDRKAAIRLAQSGHSASEISAELQRWRGLSALEADKLAGLVAKARA